MRKATFVLALLLAGLPAKAREIHPYLMYPYFSFPVPYKGLEASKETLQNMRLGCAATVRMGVARNNCLELADRLHGLVILSNEQIKHLGLVGKHISIEVRNAIKVSIDKKFEEILDLRDQLDERYPFVKRYLAPTLRLDI